MVETTTPPGGPEVWLEPVEISTRSLAASTFEPYPLDAPSCIVELEDGDAVTAYRLRRPEVEAETKLDELFIYAQMCDRDGKETADGWLWDQIAVAVQSDDGSDWVELTPEMKEQIPHAHKRQAIYARYLCRATVLFEQSEMTFGDGNWCAQLEVGPPGAPVGVLEVMVDEWNDEQRAEYRSAGTDLAVRLPTAIGIFNSIFQSCAGGTVDERPFAAERRAEFRRWLEAPFKLALVDALAAVWDAPLEVSVRFA